MVKTLNDFRAEHPIDREQVEKHKRRMLAEVRACRLRELREEAGLTQAQLAERIGVGQRQVSKIENGDLDSAKIGTIRSYLQAVGGGMAIEYVLGDQRIQWPDPSIALALLPRGAVRLSLGPRFSVRRRWFRSAAGLQEA